MKKINNLNTSSFFFIFFVISVGVQKFNYLNFQIFGIDLQEKIGISLLFFPLLFLFLSYYFGSTNKSIDTVQNSFFVNAIFTYTIFLFFFGLISGNYTQRALEELWTALLIYFSYKLAKNKNVWDLFKNRLNPIFYVFSFFVLLGTSYINENLLSLSNLNNSTSGF